MSTAGPIDESLRIAAHDALGVEIYPGTEIMTDVADQHFKHARHHTLIPQPSHDPNDPLNWSRAWKWLTMSSMALSTFNWVFGPLSLAPQVPYYMKDFDATLPQVINFIGVSILVLGFTNLIWIPLSRGFGRRPMAIVTTLITTISCIWRAKATSYNSFLGAAILCGFGAAPGETLGPVIIADITFLHERGLWMGLYQWAFFSGLMIGPIVAGVTAQRYDWQSFWWLSTAVSVFTNIWILFFLPETKWDRRSVPVDVGRSEVTDDKLTATKIENVDEGSEIGRAPSGGEAPDVKFTGKPSKAQMLPITGWKSYEPVFSAIILPFKLIRFPIVIWGAFQFTFACSCFLMLNITQSQALGAPPFNFSPASVGYTNLALFVGTSISLLTAGPLSDWVSNRATLRNRGVREPEMRLPAMLPFVVLMLVGCIVIAVGFQRGWPWEAIVVVGFTLIGIQVAAIGGIAINYVIDCYKPATGEFLVGATIIKNVWGYGMTKFMNTWIQQIGYIGPLLTIMALNAGFLLIGAVPFYFFGKRVRGWSAGSSVHRAA